MGSPIIDFLVENWVSLTTTAGVAIGWVVSKRKRDAEALDLEGDAMAKMQQAYDKFVSDSQREREEIRTEFVRLKSIVHEQEALIHEQQIQIDEQKRQIKSLNIVIHQQEIQIKQYEVQIETLTTELTKYKQ